MLRNVPPASVQPEHDVKRINFGCEPGNSREADTGESSEFRRLQNTRLCSRRGSSPTHLVSSKVARCLLDHHCTLMHRLPVLPLRIEACASLGIQADFGQASDQYLATNWPAPLWCMLHVPSTTPMLLAPGRREHLQPVPASGRGSATPWAFRMPKAMEDSYKLWYAQMVILRGRGAKGLEALGLPLVMLFAQEISSDTPRKRKRLHTKGWCAPGPNKANNMCPEQTKGEYEPNSEAVNAHAPSMLC